MGLSAVGYNRRTRYFFEKEMDNPMEFVQDTYPESGRVTNEGV
jgi:hypothetical protein